MLRLICGGVLALCISYIGLGIRRYYQARKKYYEQLTALIEIMESNVTYSKTPLPLVIGSFTDTASGELKRELTEYSRLLNTGERSGIESIKTPLLKRDERREVLDMLSRIGLNDSVSELKQLNGYKHAMMKKREETEKKAATSGNLAFKLAVLLGIVTLILTA